MSELKNITSKLISDIMLIQKKEQDKVITLLANSKPFEKWLKGFEPEEVVGTPGSSSRCPLARFAQQQGIQLRVFPYGLAVFSKCSPLKILLTEEVSLKWVADFVKAVDTNTVSDTITSASALFVLETITV